MSEEPKDCPFCGASSKDIEPYRFMQVASTNEQYVWCHGCDAHGPTRKGKANAVVAWNAIPREPAPLVWSSERPKVAGFYLWRTRLKGSCGDGWTRGVGMWLEADDQTIIVSEDHQYSGPVIVQEPKERKA